MTIRAYAGALHPTIGVPLSVLLVGRKMLRSKRGLRGSEGAGEISLLCPAPPLTHSLLESVNSQRPEVGGGRRQESRSGLRTQPDL